MDDLIIIGCGPAGMSAGIYAARLGLKTKIFEGKAPGGAMATATVIENYPGFLRISGMELTDRMLSQVKKCGAEIIMESVVSVAKVGDHFDVTTDRKNTYSSRALLIATGGEYKKLGIEGEEKFFGRGVSYCPTCDGPLFKGKSVAVIGGGDTAVQGAAYLSDICKNVYLIHRRSEFKAEEANVKKLREKENVQLFLQFIPLEIHGDNVVRSIKIQNIESGEIKELIVDGIFVCVGEVPLVILAQQLGVKLNEKGEIDVDENGRTSVQGVWAAGDVTKGPRQIITACAEGVIAAIDVYRYLRSTKTPMIIK
jgi:thioredoxin reductase (NADPH)